MIWGSSTIIGEEQIILRDSLDRYLAANFDTARRRAARRTEPHFDQSLWQALRSELGVAGVGFSEEDGGSGGTLGDQCVVLTALGRALAAEPFFGSVVMGGAFLRRSDRARARHVLAGVLDGSFQAALVQGCRPLDRERAHGELRAHAADGGCWRIEGTVSVVHGAPWASHFLVSASLEGMGRAASCILALIDRRAAGIEVLEYDTIDGNRAAQLHFQRVTVRPEDLLYDEPGETRACIDSVLDFATIALCGEGLGVLGRIFDDTVGYTRERRQFGQSLAQFQALRHRLVDMKLQIQQCEAIVHRAVTESADGPESVARLASLAKWQMSRACRSVPEAAVQLHGAVGTTEELPLADYFKRAMIIGARLGNEEYHRRRFQTLLS